MAAKGFFGWVDRDTEIDIETETVEADRGAVAVGDDLEDSAVNTGRFEGIQNGGHGDVDASFATIGDGNVTLTGSEVGAMSFGRGDATNVVADGNVNMGSGTLNDIAAENVNLGSGKLTDVDSFGGGQTVVGNGNEVTGDVSVDMDDVEGNANLAIGDGNDQAAVQDNDFSLDASYTDNSVTSYSEDNSVEDSFNTEVEDSFNTEAELTAVYEDNDVVEDNDVWHDASSYEYSYSETDLDADLHHVDDTEVDLDA